MHREEAWERSLGDFTKRIMLSRMGFIDRKIQLQCLAAMTETSDFPISLRPGNSLGKRELYHNTQHHTRFPELRPKQDGCLLEFTENPRSAWPGRKTQKDTLLPHSSSTGRHWWGSRREVFEIPKLWGLCLGRIHGHPASTIFNNITLHLLISSSQLHE